MSATAPTLPQQKTDMRRRIIAARAAMPRAARAAASQTICDKIAALSEFQSAQTIAAFASMPEEVDLWSLIESALSQGKTIALPRVADAKKRRLTFHTTTDPSQLIAGYAGILEPAAAAPVQTQFDFILVPAVAVSPQNFRLGYGGGFYDSFLKKYPSVFTCIPAFACQIVQNLPLESHDQSVKMVVNEL